MRSLLLLEVALDFYWSSNPREAAEAVEVVPGGTLLCLEAARSGLQYYTVKSTARLEYSMFCF